MLRITATIVLILYLAGCATSSNRSRSDARDARFNREAAEINVQLGTGYMQKGQLDIAQEKLNKALAFDPSYAPAHTVSAILYERLGNYDRAGEHYKKAVDHAPADGGVRNNYGTYLCRTGQLRQAETHFLKAVEDPFYSTPEVAYSNAGACARQVPDQARAEEFFRLALEFNPGFGDALFPLAEISYIRGKYLNARAFLQRFESAAADSADSLLLGHLIEKQLGDTDTAAQYADQLRRMFPDSDQVKQITMDN